MTLVKQSFDVTEENVRGVDRVIECGEEVTITGIADIHFKGYQRPGHHHEALVRWRDVVEQTPNCYVFFGGDMFEHKRTSVRKALSTLGLSPEAFDDCDEIAEQWVDQLVEFFQPIKHKIVGGVAGNHTYQFHNIHQGAHGPMYSDEVLLAKLGVHAFRTTYLVAQFRLWREGMDTYKPVNVLVHHTGPGGGTVNPLARFNKAAQAYDPDVIIFGHLHEGGAYSSKSVTRWDEGGNAVVRDRKYISLDDFKVPSADGYEEAKMYGNGRRRICYVNAGLSSKNELVILDPVSQRL